MKEERTFFINGLPNLCKELEKAGRKDDANKMIKDFLLKSFYADIDEKIERFVEFDGPVILPADLPYFNLYHEFEQLYINGLFYSMVCMSGILCERICYDKLIGNKIEINTHILDDEEKEQIIFRLSLNYQIELLEKCNLIKNDTRKCMIELNNIRNNYVHPKKTLQNAKDDSKHVLKYIKQILDNEYAIKSGNLLDYVKKQ